MLVKLSSQNLCPMDIVVVDDPDLYIGDESDHNGDDDDDIELDVVKAKKPTVNKEHVLYHASMLLKIQIASIQGRELPWPPVAADISIGNVQKIVPPTIVDFMAWILGFLIKPTPIHM